MKKIVRLTESDLHKIVKESVKKVLNEVGETPDGQRKLAALQNRNIDKWSKSVPKGDYRTVEDEPEDSLPRRVAKYAYQKSRGNDELRKAYQIKHMSDTFGDNEGENSWRNFYNQEYPNSGTIDVDGLWNELEQYARKTGLKIIESVIDGITLLGYEDDFSMKAAYADIAYIAGNYGINSVEGVTYTRERTNPKYYEVHVKCSFTDDPYKRGEDKRGDQDYLKNLSAAFS